MLKSYCADVIDGHLAAVWPTRFLNSRFDSGCFVKVFVEFLDMTVSSVFIRANVSARALDSPQRGVSGGGMMGKAQRSWSMRSICSCSGARTCGSGRLRDAPAICLKRANAEVYGVINPRNGLPGIA